MPLKHTMPAFLDGVTTPEAYERWLGRKAMAHVKRDRGRGHNEEGTTRALYKEAIHAAVVLSGGVDAYTGEKLHWHVISKYSNDKSKLGRHASRRSSPCYLRWTTLMRVRRRLASASARGGRTTRRTTWPCPSSWSCAEG